jgi:hypothetical protein
LLSLDDQAASARRSSIEDDTGHLAFAESTAILSESDAAHLIKELVRSGEQLRRALSVAHETNAGGSDEAPRRFPGTASRKHRFHQGFVTKLPLESPPQSR